MLKEVIGEVERLYSSREKIHAQTTLDLVQDFYPGKSPLALQIAAYCHDLDRSFPEKAVDTKNCPIEEYTRRKMLHACNSAYLFIQLPLDLNKPLKDDVFFLICRHEQKTSETSRLDSHTQSYDLIHAANVLWMADKATFFKVNIEKYARVRTPERLAEKLRFSLDGLPDDIQQRILGFEYSPEIRNIVDSFLKSNSSFQQNE